MRHRIVRHISIHWLRIACYRLEGILVGHPVLPNMGRGRRTPPATSRVDQRKTTQSLMLEEPPLTTTGSAAAFFHTVAASSADPGRSVGQAREGGGWGCNSKRVRNSGTPKKNFIPNNKNKLKKCESCCAALRILERRGCCIAVVLTGANPSTSSEFGPRALFFWVFLLFQYILLWVKDLTLQL